MTKQNPASKSFKVEENPYQIIYLDLTHRCNMNCNFCYNPDLNLPDLDVKFFEEVCRRLPKKVIFRFLGGEPTLHPQFFDLIDIARKYKHLPTVASNGLKYAEDSFAKEMKKHRAIYSITLSGGMFRNDIYEVIDNQACAAIKRKGLANLLKYDIREVVLSSIIMRGVNEMTIPELIGIGLNNKRNIRHVKFRSTGAVGRYIPEAKPYSTPEFRELIHKFINVEDTTVINSGLAPRCHECCYRFRYEHLKITHVEFATPNAQKCWMRGKLFDDEFIIEPYFENMVNHSLWLEENYGTGDD